MLACLNFYKILLMFSSGNGIEIFESSNKNTSLLSVWLLLPHTADSLIIIKQCSNDGTSERLRGKHL